MLKDFGSNLRQLRNLHNMTQEDLAKYLDVTRPTITGYETKGKQPDYEKLIKLSKLFNVSVDYLIGNDFNFNSPGHDVVDVKSTLENLISAIDSSNTLLYDNNILDFHVRDFF